MTCENHDYYDRNYKTYFEQTYLLDSDVFLTSFSNSLPKGATVLDVGCGSGRDLLWLKKRGFRPSGFERSKGLVRMAGDYSECPVIEGDFETYDFSGISFDAILASGSLVHIPHKRLASVVKNIKSALLPGGIFYISLKSGVGSKTGRTGRTFYMWRDADLKQMFASLHMNVLHSSETTSVRNLKDQWLGYVLK